MAMTLYTKDGRKHIVHHPVDVLAAINSGNYFETNPIQVITETPEPDYESRRPAATKSVKEDDTSQKIEPVETKQATQVKPKDDKPIKVGRI